MILGQTGPSIDWGWVIRNLDDIWQATVEHFTLTVVALLGGLVVSFGLSLVALRWNRAYAPITWVTGVLYTIPSIALFTFLVPVFGLTSILTAQVALISYTLLILIRNIVAGVRGVPTHITEASRGMGMTERRIFLGVQLPLALPAIIAGVRVAAVTTIGLVTLTVLVGQGGYGVFILRGIGRQFLTEALAGTLLSVSMAVVFDSALVVLERMLTPWSRRKAAT
jgi:osmoprotectant transport system permease protein